MATEHGLRVGVEVLVDRRADDDDDVLGVRDHRRVRGGPKLTSRHGFGQGGLAAGLRERQAAGSNLRDGGRVQVEGTHSQARVGECDAERQADMTAATHHDHVERPLHGSRD